MKNSSAKEDFKGNTLDKMTGRLAKAEYLAGLLDQGGYLSHWGLERVHGAEAARSAMANAYAEQMQGILRTSMRELWAEAEQAGSKIEAKDVLLTRIREAVESRGGKQLNEVQRCHLKLVLEALLEVALHGQTNQGA